LNYSIEGKSKKKKIMNPNSRLTKSQSTREKVEKESLNKKKYETTKNDK